MTIALAQLAYAQASLVRKMYLGFHIYGAVGCDLLYDVVHHSQQYAVRSSSDVATWYSKCGHAQLHRIFSIVSVVIMIAKLEAARIL